MSTNNHEITQFKEFVNAQRQLVEALKTIHRETAVQELTASDEYLVNKLSEGLALIFTKDINASSSWKSLASTVSLGTSLAMHAEPQVNADDLPSE